MKFKNKIKRKEKYEVAFNTLRNKFKKSYPVYIYNDILKQLLNGEEEVYYRIEDHYNTDKSFKHHMQDYHDKYQTGVHVLYLKDAFYYVFDYVVIKLSKYEDVQATLAEDEFGLYFKITVKK